MQSQGVINITHKQLVLSAGRKSKWKIACALSALTAHQLRGGIERAGPIIKSMRLSYDLEKQHQTVVCEIKSKRSQVYKQSSSLLAELANCEGVVRVRWF